MYAIAATDVSELTKSKAPGEVVNVHVVPSTTDPKPDFAAMQRLIEGREPAASEPPKDR